MKLGQTLKRAYTLLAIGMGMGLMALLPSNALAQDEAAVAAETEAAAEAANAALYTPMGQDMVKGQPIDGEWDVQPQFSDIGEYANGFHIGLIWVMAAISIFVLALLFWVIVRYNKRANPTPSKTTHNTAIEVIWTLVPVLILIGIALPSISLLSQQYESPPEDAITIKTIGVQWYWDYEYPDYGLTGDLGTAISSKMLNEPGEPVVNNGVRELGSESWDGPGQLEVDNRMVVPVGMPLRIQTTAADVIHSFAVPSLWFKLDAVPGRLNERLLTVNEPGIYYGQCSELCGVKHGYMPIAVEALPMDKFEDWVRSKGGTIPGEEEASEDADSTATEEVADEVADAAIAE